MTATIPFWALFIIGFFAFIGIIVTVVFLWSIIDELKNLPQ